MQIAEPHRQPVQLRRNHAKIVAAVPLCSMFQVALRNLVRVFGQLANGQHCRRKARRFARPVDVVRASAAFISTSRACSWSLSSTELICDCIDWLAWITAPQAETTPSGSGVSPTVNSWLIASTRLLCWPTLGGHVAGQSLSPREDFLGQALFFRQFRGGASGGRDASPAGPRPPGGHRDRRNNRDAERADALAIWPCLVSVDLVRLRDSMLESDRHVLGQAVIVSHN